MSPRKKAEEPEEEALEQDVEETPEDVEEAPEGVDQDAGQAPVDEDEEPTPSSDEASETPFEREQRLALQAFREREPDLPEGLEHGVWTMEPQYVCSFCEVGYLSLDAAREHLEGRHPGEIQRIRLEREDAERRQLAQEPEESAPEAGDEEVNE
jgi:hypothetical protein